MGPLGKLIFPCFNKYGFRIVVLYWRERNFMPSKKLIIN